MFSLCCDLICGIELNKRVMLFTMLTDKSFRPDPSSIFRCSLCWLIGDILHRSVTGSALRRRIFVDYKPEAELCLYISDVHSYGKRMHRFYYQVQGLNSLLIINSKP